uniref:GRANULINS domain-containing protein n=1 Tax=Globodera pallida TaxID=36090 RepID=A0A183BJW9_GLOPA
MDVSKSVVAAFALLTALTLPGLSWGDDSASAPKVLTPCEKLAAKCSKQSNNWGECFPRDGYNGDACCDKGNAWKCGIDMTMDERISKDPTYAKMMNCALAGHPDMESLKKCLPDKSECKSTCLVQLEDFEGCPIQLL